MPVMLVCPCSHSTPLPEQSGGYRCSKCGERIELTYYRGPGAWARWQLAQIASGRVRAEQSEGARVELRA